MEYTAKYFCSSGINVTCNGYARGLTVCQLSQSEICRCSKSPCKITAVSSDSRPPNPKCLTVIIVFDIWEQPQISQQGMVSAQFWEKYCILCLFSSCEILVCCEFDFGIFYWIDDRTWMSKTTIDVKYFEFRWSWITRNCCKLEYTAK